MTTGYQEFPLTESFKNSHPKLLSNDKAALTCNAGTAFPDAANTFEGMLCYRTDEKKLYQYVNGAWSAFDYLPLQGGTLTGDLTANGIVKGIRITADNGVNTNLDFWDSHDDKHGGWYLATTSHPSGGWAEIWTTSNLTNVSQLTNNSGYITDWGVRGSENASIEFKPSSTQTHGGFIDFHFKGSTADFTSRIIEKASGSLSIEASNALTYNGVQVATTSDTNACVKLAGSTLNNWAKICRNTAGTTWINGRDAALVKNLTTPSQSWGPITSSKSDNGSWEMGVLGDNFYIVYSKDSDYNAKNNSVFWALNISPSCSVATSVTLPSEVNSVISYIGGTTV